MVGVVKHRQLCIKYRFEVGLGLSSKGKKKQKIKHTFCVRLVCESSVTMVPYSMEVYGNLWTDQRY